MLPSGGAPARAQEKRLTATHCLVYRASPARPVANEHWSPVNLKLRNLLHLKTEANVDLLYASVRGGEALGSAVLAFETRTADQCLRGIQTLPHFLGLTDFWVRLERLEGPARVFDRPLIILAAPRSGSGLLFDLLANSPDIWTVGGESIQVIDAIWHLHPENRGFESHTLGAGDADPATRERLLAFWLAGLVDRDGMPYLHLPERARLPQLRFMENTPRNSLRVPFLRAMFPDARFIFLFRDPRENLSSIMEVWEVPPEASPFVYFERLPGSTRQSWRMLLPPGWRSLEGKPLVDVAARQWQSANEAILDGVEDLGPDRLCVLTYAQLISESERTLHRVVEFCGIRSDDRMARAVARMAPSRYTISPPRPDKWRARGPEIEARIPELLPTVRRFENFAARHR